MWGHMADPPLDIVVRPNVLLAVRDGIRSRYGSSVQITNQAGKVLAVDRVLLRRAFVSNVCQKYICNEDSPTNKARCDDWDNQAMKACLTSGSYVHRCHAGFSCVAESITFDNRLLGMIFAGERAVQDVAGETTKEVGANLSETTREQVLDRLLSDRRRKGGVTEQDLDRLTQDFRESWRESSSQAAMTTAQWKDLRDAIRSAATFLAKCYEYALEKRESGRQGQLGDVDLLDRARTVLDPPQREHIDRILAAGLLVLTDRFLGFFDGRGVMPGEGLPATWDAFIVRAEILPDLESAAALDPEPLVMAVLSIIRDLVASVSGTDWSNAICVPDSHGLTAAFRSNADQPPRVLAPRILQLAVNWSRHSAGNATRSFAVCCGVSQGIVSYGPRTLSPQSSEFETDRWTPVNPQEICMIAGLPVLSARHGALLASQLHPEKLRVAADSAFTQWLDARERHRFESSGRIPLVPR